MSSTLIPMVVESDGRFEDLLYVDGGPGSTKTVGHLRMNGREVFRHAVQKISGVIEETLAETGSAADEIDLYIPHQANKRIIDGIAKKLGVAPEKIAASTLISNSRLGVWLEEVPAFDAERLGGTGDPAHASLVPPAGDWIAVSCA